MNRTFPGTAVLAAALLAGGASFLRAETTGVLRGHVDDDSSRPLAGAQIVVGSAGRGIGGRAAVTDSAGAFSVTALPDGVDYAVHVTFPGLAPLDLSGVEIRAGRTTTVHLTLQPSTSLRERVQVSALPDVVDLENTTTETRLSSEFIDALPILGRDYQDILTLAPGVTDTDGDGSPNIHGARDTDVITFVDGVNTTDPLTGKIGAQLNIESIQEIEIKTSGATAEFGRAQGGFANILTKSGGNALDGTFKFYWRGSLLDGDGAGTDDPRLHGGFGENGLRDLTFNDLLPFFSLGGPIVRDRAWFFTTTEYVQREDPVNAVRASFLATTRETREFAKFTWQAGASHRLALSINYDPQQYFNQGLNSFTRTESGFTDRTGGTVVTLRSTSILSPSASLETSLSSFDERPARIPNLDADTNGNGVLYYDRNHDGFDELAERDPGEDRDLDGAFDVNEPVDVINGVPVFLQDRDGDGTRTPPGDCEGLNREDVDCDGRLDPGEDRNHNGVLDDTPHPTSLYPYGHLRPWISDRAYTLDRTTGQLSGPYYEDQNDSRRRLSLRQDLSIYVPEFRGAHDLKTGFLVEREAFDRDVSPREFMAQYIPPNRGSPYAKSNPASPRWGNCFGDGCPKPIEVAALLPSQTNFRDQATGLTAGLYAQDTYKPRPNFSLGLGLRFDREMTESIGYTWFDPAPERALFNRLGALIGVERATGDSVIGDDNGIVSLGVTGDPIFTGTTASNQVRGDITDAIQIAMLRLFMRSHTDVAFGSAALGSLIPLTLVNGQIDRGVLEQAGVTVQSPRTLQLTNNNLSPRLSVSWDPWANGRSKLFGTWGRYYDKLFLSSVVGEEGPDWLNRYYEFDNSRARDRVEFDRRLRTDSASPPSITQIDRGLSTPFSDELTIGFEREIGSEVALGLTFVDRQYRRQLQDIDVNHYLRIDPRTGQPLDALGLIERITPTDAAGHQIGNTFYVRAPDGRPDLYIYNLYFNQILRLGNSNQSRYRALELQVRRRLARRWEMQASYTYSRAVGDAEDYQSRLGNDPSTVESEYGYLAYDQRHVVKLNASSFLPRDWQVGTSITWASGLPYSIVSRFFAYDSADYQQFRTRYGYTVQQGPDSLQFVPVRRNSLRNDATLDVNVRARRAMVIRHTSAALFLEVFNLLNRDDLRIYTYEPTPDSLPLNLQTMSATGQQGVDAVRRFGRRFQVGMQFDF